MNATRYATPGLLALLAALTLSAGPGGDRATAQVTNLGLATSVPVVDAGYAAFLVSENMQGGADLNGDGDTLDLVLHLYDADAGSTTNLGFACLNQIYLYKGFLAFSIDEAGQGAVDLNGDGDSLDRVVHVHDLGKGATVNLGLAQGWNGAMGEGSLVFDVSEADQNLTDFNGDGDTLDRVLHVYDLATATTTNTGLAGSLVWNQEPSDGLVLATVWEPDQGNSDLNGDGDALDTIMHAVQLPSGTAINTGLPSWSAVIFPGRIALGALELDHGNQDLNGDGDTSDEVLHVYDVATSTANNQSLAVIGFGMARAGTHLAFLVQENGQGSADLNGDLDATDLVMHVHHVPSATTLNLALASVILESGFWTDGERLAFPVSEWNQGGSDLNGDLDALDAVVHTYDPIQGLVTNLGLASYSGVLRGKRLTLSVSEFDQTGSDLNGDGDTADTVLHEHDLATGVTNNLGIAGMTAWNGDETLLEIYESQEGSDLNGDGDMTDSVLHAHESFAGAPDNLGLAGNAVGFDDGLQLMQIWEAFHGSTDLNGDGDALDSVLFTVKPLYPFGLETDADRMSVGAGGTLAFELDAGHAHRGDFYLILGSFSGTAPGLLLGSVLIPLNPDPYFNLTIKAPNAPPFAASLGLLDIVGEGQAAFSLPPGSPPILTSITANHAFVVLDSATGHLTFASNAVPLRFIP